MDRTACHFVFYSGPRKGEAQAFDTARISIGRAGSCDFRLESFQLDQVAPQHAEVLLEDGNIYCLYDLGSKAGTWVNGERVHERCALMHEDYVRFGLEGPEVIFRTGLPVPGTQPLPQMFPVSAELEYFSGSDAGRIFPVNAGVLSNIGRRADLEVPLDPRGDMIVSGNHCNIRYVNGHFVLTDSSRNGTYVNGELLDQPMEILEGDVIMLGDGGPQARFHVDSAKRHYPNHRPLSPVIKREAPAPAPPVSALQPNDASAGALGLLSAIPMQSAKPYTTGVPASAVTPPNTSAPGNGDPVGSEDLTSPASNPVTDADASDADNDAIPGDQEKPVAETDPASAAPPASNPFNKLRFAMPAIVPLAHKLKFKPGRKVVLGAIAVVVLIGIIALWPSGDKTPSDSSVARGNYEEALEDLTPLKNMPGTFTVQVPKAWTTLNSDNYISTESNDKEVAVDYVRDPKLNEAHMRQLLQRNGAQIIGQPEETTVDGVKVKTLKSRVGNTHLMAALHQPSSGAPAMAFLETSEQSLSRLDEDSINLLLVKNLTAPPIPAQKPPAAPPAPAPASTGGLPKPTAATPIATAAAVTPEASPSPTASPTDATTSASAVASGKTVKSKALNVTLTAPTGWEATSEEADGMILFSDGSGLEIRIARDPGALKSASTFKAMTDEGWKKDEEQLGTGFQAGEFSKQNQNLMLILVPEKQKSTIVIYATSKEEFTAVQRKGVTDIMLQLLPAR